MNTRFLQVLIVLLAAIIIVLAWLLFALPAPQSPTPPPIASSTAATSTTGSAAASSSTAAQGPLHDRIVIDSPKQGASVGHSFTVRGQAPGPWFYEAVFPIKILDKDRNVIGSAQGRAQGAWTTDAQVPFTADVQIAGSYRGNAVLVLLRDNPSGLPENDDALEVPIVIQ